MAKIKNSTFDQIINRREVPALKTHRMVLGDNSEHLFAAGVADMDFKPPQAVLDALQQRLEHGVFGYEAVPDDMFPALINWFETRHKWSINKTHILRAPNILNILAIAASLFSNENDGIIVQPPVFFDFFDILQENHRQLISNPLVLRDARYTMDFDDLELKATDPTTKMIYLCNPHNPVGRVWSKNELQRLGDICNRHDVLVISDEIHGDITFPGHDYTPYASLGEDYADNSITCLSPAKSFNIAACCSAFTIISNEERRKAFQVENSRLTVNKNNSFSSAAMLAAYTNGTPWLEDVLAYIQINVELVRQRLKNIPKVTLIEPEGTFLLWLDFRALNMPPKQLTQFLKQDANWAVTRGEAFGTQGEGFARVNIACPTSVLEKALDQLKIAVSQL